LSISLPHRRINDPYLGGFTAEDKALVLGDMFCRRYDSGKREKEAHGVGAAVRKHFVMAHEDTRWLDASTLSVIRRSCRRSVDENRAYIKAGKGKARLPVWQGLIDGMRDSLWVGHSWSLPGIDKRLIYIATVYSFDLAVRASETVAPAKGTNDHAVRAEDFTFNLRLPVLVKGVMVYSVQGGSDILCRHVRVDNVQSVLVAALSHKVGKINHKKLIGRRSPDEEQFLEDLVLFSKRSGVAEEEMFFSRRATQKNGRVTHKKLQTAMVSSELKKAVVAEDLCPDLFSFHSLRKGGITR
jgi:hypothetical protein